MANQHWPLDQLHEMAAAYAIGALDADERLAFEEHLRGGCGACDAELRDYADITGGLAEGVASDPPPKLRRRVLMEASRDVAVPAALPPGVLIARSDEIPWRPMFDGVEFKLLHTDRVRRYSTSLVRMEPGSRIPRHRHDDVEELYILSGDLRISGALARAGDYCRAVGDSIHEESISQSGCLFLLIASHQNEVLA